MNNWTVVFVIVGIVVVLSIIIGAIMGNKAMNVFSSNLESTTTVPEEAFITL